MMFAAALLLPIALLQADAAPAAAAADRFAQCAALIETAPDRAYEEGMAWASETHALGGYRCAALALIAQNRPEDGARRLESLAVAMNPAEVGLRAELLSQAGNAWLLAHEAGQARSAFTRAIATLQGDRMQLPDLYIDRARAYAMEADWRHAEEDLSQSLDIRANDALALRLRAEARLQQRAFDLAEADAAQALRLGPSDVDNALTLGRVRESRRLGAPVESN